MTEEEAPSSSGGFTAKMSFSTGNVAEHWRIFKRKLQFYFDSKFTEKSLTNRKKTGVLMTALGDDGIDLLETLFDPSEQPTFQEIIAAFDKHCKPKKNTVFERSVYFRLVQKPGQAVDAFILELKKQAAVCEFADVEKENLLRDIMVIGLQDAKLQEELLRDPELNLQKVVQAAKARERSQNEAQQMEALITPGKLAIASIEKRVNSSLPSTSSSSTQSLPRCSACGYFHGNLRPCPAVKGTCNSCGQTGHFAKMCRRRLPPKKVKAVETNDEPKVSEEQAHTDMLRIYGFRSSAVQAVGEDDEECTAWYVSLALGESVCVFKIDTAAECDTISQTSYDQLTPRPPLLPSSTVIMPYNAKPFRPLGKIVIPLDSMQLELQVMPGGEENLLGFKTCRRLGLIQRVSRLNTFVNKDVFVLSNADLFKGEGKIPGLNKIYVDSSISPKVARPRRFAYTLTEKLIATLKIMVEQDVIVRVTEPTPWVSNITVVEKIDGSLRICLDPQNLNKAIQIPKYAIPKTDDILVKLVNKKFFTVLDLKSGFWHMQLDEESSKLTTFNSPIGRFRFKRLCFGINCAPEMFMAEMVRIFGDIPDVSPYFDDLIIATTTEEQHDQALQLVCSRAHQHNIKFNPSKIQFKQSCVQYLGLFISELGLQPAAKHVRALQEMTKPTDKLAVLRFLGLVKFLARFIPNVSQLTANLRNLTRKDVKFLWNEQHESEFENLKKIILAKPVLAFFDATKPVVVQTDSSKDGLGSVLLQEEQPVAFASRALTPAEVKYSQIEKELLAIVFAVEKFHEFVYGHPVEVHSDHRPLEAILQKDLDKVSARLQRLRLRLLKYNVTVKYVPGKQMLVADALSRAYLCNEEPNLEYHTVTVHAAKALAVSPEKVNWIASETAADPVLSVVKQWVTLDTWPSNTATLAPGTARFASQRHVLMVVDEMLFVENRLVVPATLRQFFLEKLHEGHLGIEKTKRLARDSVFWHGMTADIVNYVSSCTTCQKFARNNAKEPLKSYPISLYPWQQIAADIATFERRDYLIVVDKYSNWPEVVQLQTKTAQEVVLHLTNLFARHGIPEIVISDNNPFNSAVYQSFAEEWGFTPVYTSPHFSQSNGHAEKAVQTIKMMLKKCFDEKANLQYALLQYRNTPLADTGYSPAQALVGRRLRTKLPIASTLLEPNSPPASEIRANKERSRDVQEYYYNRAAEELPPLQPNQPVWVKDDLAEKEWQPATIRRHGSTPRSFIVEKEGKGGEVVRNRRFLRPRKDIRKPERFVP